MQNGFALSFYIWVMHEFLNIQLYDAVVEIDGLA